MAVAMILPSFLGTDVCGPVWTVLDALPSEDADRPGDCERRHSDSCAMRAQRTSLVGKTSSGEEFSLGALSSMDKAGAAPDGDPAGDESGIGL